MKKTATIYDYERMCRSNSCNCKACPLLSSQNGIGISCGNFVRYYPDDANEIILNWCKEHPVETRQDRFLKMFPNAQMLDGVINICPEKTDGKCYCATGEVMTCRNCKKEHWLAEVEENE